MTKTTFLIRAAGGERGFGLTPWRFTSKEIDAAYPAAHDLYLDLHQHPELSAQEVQTAAKLAERLRGLGYEVTEHVGGTGVVALLKNGAGPTVMLRTELDALPVEEKTGLPYASKVQAKDDAGREVPVMHACGHDLHMATLYATAAVMARSKDTWHGTLMLIGQPAEETIGGARAMIKDGLVTRFPKPDFGVALHVGNTLPAGTVGITPGIYDSNADSERITIYGKGGHGSAPHTAVDPIVIAAKTIVALQTITSREVRPGEFAVITVGYIRAGAKKQHHSRRSGDGIDNSYVQGGGAEAGAGGNRSRGERRVDGRRRNGEPLMTFRVSTNSLRRSGAGGAARGVLGGGAWETERDHDRGRSRHRRIIRRLSSWEFRQLCLPGGSGPGEAGGSGAGREDVAVEPLAAVCAGCGAGAEKTGVAAEVAVLEEFA